MIFHRLLSPKPAQPVHVDGYRTLPALFNAHDHLELNHYPRTKYRERYDDAHQWGEDVNNRLDTAPFRELRAAPLGDRLFIGGLKNLLCGALIVAHHNPPHRPLFRRDYPVRVVRRYGWAHSLHFNHEQGISAAYRKTPTNAPFFIHLAEGTSDRAQGEYRRLKALGVVGANTVIVHGVGLTPEDIVDAAPRIRALVTCPTTNHYLLGATADLNAWHAAGGTVWVGSDSRLTADGDMLDELAALHMPLTFAAHPTGLGTLDRSDYILIPNDIVHAPRRADIALIVRGGVPRIGHPELMQTYFPHVATVSAHLDGTPKQVERHLADQIRSCSLQERGFALE